MANSLQARKRARQAEKNRRQNASHKSRFRTHVKRVEACISNGDAEGASTAYRQAVPVIDSMVSRGLIHRNKAARHKSRLNSKVKVLATAS